MSKIWDKKSFTIASLRRASYRWPPREAARRLAKVGRNQYTCVKCKGVFPRKGTKIDHIEPVVCPIKGWQGFDSFSERLLCNIDGFQVLCNEDHKVKTKAENELRRQHKKKTVAKKTRKC